MILMYNLQWWKQKNHWNVFVQTLDKLIGKTSWISKLGRDIFSIHESWYKYIYFSDVKMPTEKRIQTDHVCGIRLQENRN